VDKYIPSKRRFKAEVFSILPEISSEMFVMYTRNHLGFLVYPHCKPDVGSFLRGPPTIRATSWEY
jgi:hypothetical protein